MENFKEIDENHFPMRRKLESKIISEEVDNQKNIERKENNGFYKEFVNKIKKSKKNSINDIFKANNEIETIISDKYVKKGSPSSRVQVLRSVGEWSLGLKMKENSILESIN